MAAVSENYSIVLGGHGSQDSDSIQEFIGMVALVRERSDRHPVYWGYLEFASPTIAEAVEQSVREGASRVVVVPCLLAAATHAKNDMPVQLQQLRSIYPDVEIHFGSAAELHPLLLKLCQRRIVEAEAQSNKVIKRSETCLVVVGRGTSDPDANSEISKLSRFLEEGMGFGASYVCYSGTAKPLVATGLRNAALLGHQRIVVLPYMLFDGVLVKRIYEAADALQERCPDIEVLKANYLGVAEEVADVFLERAQEGIAGKASMNCSLCKYRTQIVGFESEVSAPQVTHHTLFGDKNEVMVKPRWQRYEPHPIEAESFSIIAEGYDWSGLSGNICNVLQRLVHTSGDFSVVDDVYISPGAIEAGMRALLRCRRVVTDVTMVQSGLKRTLLDQLGIVSWCGVHERETLLMSESLNITRCAAGIRRAWQKWGNDLVIAIGDAPTAVIEVIRLIREHQWRPQFVVGLPVGFVGTIEAKQELRNCLQIPRVTNACHKGGSPWAAALINALMINVLNELACQEQVDASV